MTSALRLGLLGGSFDPVHRGHLHVAAGARAAFDLGRVLFMPAAVPPHKLDVRLAPGADRLAMIRLAIADRPEYDASDLELKRSGPSYTVDTVRSLVAQDNDVHLILGSDNLPGLPGWHAVRELLELATPVIVWRAGDPPGVPAQVSEALGPRLAARLEAGFLELPPGPGRATHLRAALARGERDLEDLPHGVEEYISERGLYRTP